VSAAKLIAAHAECLLTTLELQVVAGALRTPEFLDPSTATTGSSGHHFVRNIVVQNIIERIL
jgi:hypothetical protein